MQRSCTAAAGFKLLPTFSTAPPPSSSLSLCDHLKRREPPSYLTPSLHAMFGLSARSGALNRSTFAAHFLREGGIAESDQDAVSKTSSGRRSFFFFPPLLSLQVRCTLSSVREQVHGGVCTVDSLDLYFNKTQLRP